MTVLYVLPACVDLATCPRWAQLEGSKPRSIHYLNGKSFVSMRFDKARLKRYLATSLRLMRFSLKPRLSGVYCILDAHVASPLSLSWDFAPVAYVPPSPRGSQGGSRYHALMMLCCEQINEAGVNEIAPPRSCRRHSRCCRVLTRTDILYMLERSCSMGMARGGRSLRGVDLARLLSSCGNRPSRCPLFLDQPHITCFCASSFNGSRRSSLFFSPEFAEI